MEKFKDTLPVYLQKKKKKNQLIHRLWQHPKIMRELPQFRQQKNRKEKKEAHL